jgi:hypothetical protein
MTEPQPAGGGVFLTPPNMPEGETAPPMGLIAVVALTKPDAAGRVWVVLQLSDDTVSAQFRIPWQVAAPLGQNIGEQLAQAAGRAQAMAGPSLFIPGVNMPDGPLPPPPPVNGWDPKRGGPPG